MKQLLIVLLLILLLVSCKSSKVTEPKEKDYISANPGGKGPEVILEFEQGKEHNHPSFVLWAEDSGKLYSDIVYNRISGNRSFWPR